MTSSERSKEWRKNNPGYAQAQLDKRRKQYAEDPEYRAYTLRYCVLSRYKKSPEQFEADLAAQGGHCALCPAVATAGTEERSARNLHQDHDPACCDKKFKCGNCNRGILCSVCNIRLGYLEGILSDCFLYPVTMTDTWTYKACQYLDSYARLRRINDQSSRSLPRAQS